MAANKVILNDEVLIDLTEDTATEEDVAKGKTFHKADGSLGVGTGGGGAELNIAYGDTAPEDTSKLWVKTSEPNGVVVSTIQDDFEVDGEGTASFTASTALPSTWHAGAAIGEVDGNVYMLGGAEAPGSSNCRTTTEILCFDTETEVFTTLAAVMPASLYWMASATIGSKIYSISGSTQGQGTGNYRGTIYCFDVETQTITTVASMIGGLNYQAVAVGTNIFVFRVYTATDAIYRIDTVANTVEKLSFSMPWAVTAGAVISDGQIIYHVGGDGSGDILRIDIEGQSVTKVGECGVTDIYRAVLLGNTVCAIGSADGLYTIGTFNLETKIQKTYSISSFIGYNYQFYFANVVAVSDKMYIFYGYKNNNASNANKINNAYIFKNAAELTILVASGFLRIIPQEEKNLFQLINAETAKVELGVKSIYKGNAEGIGEQVEAALYKDGTWTTI